MNLFHYFTGTKALIYENSRVQNEEIFMKYLLVNQLLYLGACFAENV